MRRLFAVAQEEKIFTGGPVWLDRNADGEVGDEPGLAPTGA